MNAILDTMGSLAPIAVGLPVARGHRVESDKGDPATNALIVNLTSDPEAVSLSLETERP